MCRRKLFYKKLASQKICTVQKNEFAKLWNLHLCFCAKCKSCISKIICAADLRILCTTVFAHFAELSFCVLHLCAENFPCRNIFSQFAHLSKMFCEHARTWKYVFEHVHTEISVFEQNRQNVEKVEKLEKVEFGSVGFWRVPENVRKKLTCSWVVHEWFLAQRVWQHRVAKVARICIN